MANNKLEFAAALVNIEEVIGAVTQPPNFISVDHVGLSGTRIRSGGIYEVYSGTFGSYPEVLLKRAVLARLAGRRSHEEIVLNDITKSQILSGCPYIARLFHYERNATFIILVAERYQINCKEFLVQVEAGMYRQDKYKLTQVFTQLFTAVEYLHKKNIVHRDIRAKNMYLQQFSSSSDGWILRLGGLKYAKVAADIESEDSGPESYEITLPVARNQFRTDIFQAGFVMYCFLKGQNVTDPTPFVPDWGVDLTYPWKKLHLKHIIKLILNNERISIRDILTHPFFWDINRTIAFEDRLRSFYVGRRKVGDYTLENHLELQREQVFSTDTWTEKLPEEVVNQCENVDTTSFVGLWNARRNRRHHRDEDSPGCRRLLGPLQDSNFSFWEKRFPAFILHLYKRLSSYGQRNEDLIHQTNEFFQSPFFPSSAEFYQMVAAAASKSGKIKTPRRGRVEASKSRNES